MDGKIKKKAIPIQYNGADFAAAAVTLSMGSPFIIYFSSPLVHTVNT